MPISAERPDNYLKWNQQPSETLLEMGIQYRDTTLNMGDSALVCFSIVANRYYKEKQSVEEIRQSIKAMISIGCMYYYLYYDYEKALYYLKEAQLVAQKHNQMDMMASIHYDFSYLFACFYLFL